MVDFNSEQTVSTPATELVKVLILQRRNDLIDAMEKFNTDLYLGVQGTATSMVRSRLISLFFEIQPILKRKMTNEVYNKLKDTIFFEDDLDSMKIRKAVIELNEFIDEIKITRIDTRKQYDRTIVESQNKEHGL